MFPPKAHLFCQSSATIAIAAACRPRAAATRHTRLAGSTWHTPHTKYLDHDDDNSYSYYG